MRASLHDILNRHKTIDVRPGGLDDFTLGPAEDVDISVAAAPTWSLYSLDFAREHAVFVELPRGADLAQAPFFGVMQFRLAQRVLAMPLAAMEALAEDAAPQKPPVLIYSMGRCGSTLLSAILNGSGAMWSLSEPWAIDAVQQGESALGRPRATTLLRAVRTLLDRPPEARRGQRLALKFRSQLVLSAPLLNEALPDATNIFLYRDALGWAQSRQRLSRNILRQLGECPSGPARAWRLLSGAVDLAQLGEKFGFDPATASDAQALAASWTAYLQQLDALRRRGMKIFAMRYDDLVHDRRALARLFAFCGAPPPSEAALTAILGCLLYTSPSPRD